jgi:hypothetical protein
MVFGASRGIFESGWAQAPGLFRQGKGERYNPLRLQKADDGTERCLRFIK